MTTNRLSEILRDPLKYNLSDEIRQALAELYGLKAAYRSAEPNPAGFEDWTPKMVAGLHWAYWECAQIAGKALGYPWFKDDQKNFPRATEENGVCVGEHVPESIVEELAKAYEKLQASPWRSMEPLRELIAKYPTPWEALFMFPDRCAALFDANGEQILEADGPMAYAHDETLFRWIVENVNAAPLPQVKQQQEPL